MLRRSFPFYTRAICSISVSRYGSTEKAPKLLPKQIVKELDRFIVGQHEAKKAVAVALHNRWRREQLEETLKKEVHPKNMLMIGPTGVGKTEIARRLAKLCNAPFIKVEATKYTETGFHGSDVDTIIKDLVNVSIAQKKKLIREQCLEEVGTAVEDKILTSLMGDYPSRWDTRLRSMLREGVLDNLEISVPKDQPSTEDHNNENLQGQIVALHVMSNIADMDTPVEMETKRIGDAWDILERQQLEQLNELREEEINREAINDVQELGIVFIDEIDKICTPSDLVRSRGDASDEGVQRDLLPLIEGTVIETKSGDVDTSKILFIAAGAFYSAKPSDILPELQGRLPIRVTLNPLTEEDMYRILVEPEYNLIRQQEELMKTEEITVSFPDESVRELARLATEINRSIENIGARRLHTLLEKIMEQISFECKTGESYVISIKHIRTCVQPMLEKADTARYII